LGQKKAQRGGELDDVQQEKGGRSYHLLREPE